MNYSLLYLGTFATLTFSATMIFFIIWSARQNYKQKLYNTQRDEFYVKRIDALENIVKKECRELFNQIKKL